MKVAYDQLFCENKALRASLAECHTTHAQTRARFQEELQQKNAEMQRKDAEMQRKDADILRKKAEIDGLSANVHNRDSMYSHCRAQLDQATQQCHVLDRQLLATDEERMRLLSSVRAYDAQAKQLRGKIKAHEEEASRLRWDNEAMHDTIKRLEEQKSIALEQYQLDLSNLSKDNMKKTKGTKTAQRNLFGILDVELMERVLSLQNSQDRFDATNVTMDSTGRLVTITVGKARGATAFRLYLDEQEAALQKKESFQKASPQKKKMEMDLFKSSYYQSDIYYIAITGNACEGGSGNKASWRHVAEHSASKLLSCIADMVRTADDELMVELRDEYECACKRHQVLLRRLQNREEDLMRKKTGNPRFTPLTKPCTRE